MTKVILKEVCSVTHTFVFQKIREDLLLLHITEDQDRTVNVYILKEDPYI